MIVATVTLIVLMLGSGAGFSFDMYRKAAGDVIQDKQIVKQIKSVTKAADKEMKNWQKDANKIAKQIVEMNQNYDLARTDVEPFLNQVDSRRNEFQEKLIQLRFQARDLMSQAEWEAMYAQIE
jgi:D-mannonate dehydratase